VYTVKNGKFREKLRHKKNLNPFHQMLFLHSKYAKIAFCSQGSTPNPVCWEVQSANLLAGFQVAASRQGIGEGRDRTRREGHGKGGKE